MRYVKIDLSSDQNYPQRVFGGYAGEHNETKLIVTLPSRMVSEDVSYYYFDFHTVYNEQITSPNIYEVNEDSSVSILIWGQLIDSPGDLTFDVSAIKEDNSGNIKVIGKTTKITLQIKGELSAEPVLIDVEKNKELLQESLNALSTKLLAEDAKIQTALNNEITRAQTAEGNRYTKSETYNREEIDQKVAGAFKFKGEVESKNKLPTDASEGDVYQVGEKEYAWNGNDWVELGFNVDLTAYIKTTDAESKIATAKQEAINTSKTYTDSLVGDINTILATLVEVTA